MIVNLIGAIRNDVALGWWTPTGGSHYNVLYPTPATKTKLGLELLELLQPYAFEGTLYVCSFFLINHQFRNCFENAIRLWRKITNELQSVTDHSVFLASVL
jgi:hypothetical protein